MGISERIGEFYSGLEEKFFSVMDFIEEKGLPVYSVIDPVEEKGIPFFPVALAGVLAVALIVYGLFFIAPGWVTLNLSLVDETGTPLRSVNITAIDQRSGNGLELGSTTFQDGQEIKIPVTVGTKIILRASKQDYETAEKEVYFRNNLAAVELKLKKHVSIGQAELRLIDSETGDVVENAKVVAKFSESASIECVAHGSGSYICPGLAQGEETTLTVTQANYEQKSFGTILSFAAENEIPLVPKASASRGKSNVIVRVFDFDTKQRLGNFTMKVFDAKDNGLITERTDTDGDGEQAEKISKGNSVRIVIERKDYLNYDSGVVAENITLRDDEIIREFYLRAGTNTLTVSVLDATARPLPSIEVLLFNSRGESVAQKRTTIAGEVVFEGLLTDQVYFVSAWEDKYVPIREQVKLSEINRASLTMQRGTANNSGSLTIYTVDEKSTALSGVALNFFVRLDENSLAPLGIPAQKTDVTGKFSLIAPLNSEIVIKAATINNLAGEAKIRVVETFQNEVVVTLAEPFSRVLLKVLDDDGKEVEGGTISIFATDDILFEGEYEEGGVTFSPRTNKYVSVIYSDSSGKGFEEEILIEDQNFIAISRSGKTSVGTTPLVEFLGVFNIGGGQSNGLVKGEDVFLKFRVVYPQGSSNQNGLHVRLGEDSVGFVDSQDAGITGFSALGAANFYARSYSPNPKPGFEALDLENSGIEGSYNKWIELYFPSGGEKIINIRAKAKETAQFGEIELHYRAWSTIAGKTYRSPVDNEIGLEKFSSSKTGLYAQANLDKLKIFEQKSSCANSICASYKFVGSDGSEYSVDDFKAVLGEVYALQIDVAPVSTLKLTLKGSTVRQKPKIGFQGFGINDFSDFPDTNSTDTAVQLDNVSVAENEAASVRLYFKALDTDNTNITLQLVSDSGVINEQFYFNVFRENIISLRIVPDAPQYGEDFVIGLEDGHSQPIENAQIKIESISGKRIETIVGDGSAKKGASGRYTIKNFFDFGVIKYEVSAPTFKVVEGVIEISKPGVLEWGTGDIFIGIPKSQKSAEKFSQLQNKSRQNAEKLTFEVKPIGVLPEGMTIRVNPLSNIAANSSQNIGIVAEYSGDKESVHAEVRIIAKGKTENGLSAIAQTKVVAEYNPTVLQECLEFSKEKLVVFVASGMEDRGYYDRQYLSNSPTYYGAGNFYDPDLSAQSSYYGNRYNTGSGYTGSDYSNYGSGYNNYGNIYGSGNYNQTNPYSGFNNTYNQYGSGYYKYAGYSTSASETFTAKLAGKPECQVELQLKPEIIGEGKRTEGLEVDVKQIQLTAQLSEVQGRRSDSDDITVSVTNNLLRNYPGRENFKFDIIFKGDTFSKSIPLEVVIWNPRYALQFNRNIDLFLGPSDPSSIRPGLDGARIFDSATGTGYSAQVPLFVRNVGQADIENIHFRVLSANSRGNVDIRVVPDFPIQVLRKGESLDPPLTLLAQALRNEKTTLLDVKQLDITGVIDGASFSFGPVILTSHISGAQCLIAVPGNIAFISSKSSEGALSHEIRLKNTCAEEVRVLDISRQQIGLNTLRLVPTNAFIPPGAEAAFTLVLEKRENYNGSPVPLNIRAFLPRSGTPIDSTPIVVDIKLGKDVLKGVGATEAITLNVCEGGTKEVRFPAVASSPTCDTAYCDSVQLANFLSDRLEDRVREAEKQVHNLGDEVFNARGCSQTDLARGFCSFEGLGVKQETYVAYFAHDNLSTSLLQKSISAKNSSIKNYRVDFFQGTSAGEFLGGYSKQVFLNSNIRGCGRYRITLNGNVLVQGSKLVPELMNVVVNIAPEDEGANVRQITEQCLPNIQNINNFLPRDEGFTKTQKYDSWMGVVEPRDQALENLAGEVANTLFGSKERAVSGSVGTNALTIDLGSNEGYIVRVEMDKIAAENPVSVRAFIRESIGAEQQLQTQIAKEAGQAIKNLRDNVVDGCIGADESYMLLKSGQNLGNLQSVVKDTLRVQFDTLQCAPIELTSNIKENVTLFARKSTAFEGLKNEPVFKAQRPLDGPDTTELINTVKVDKLDGKTNKFKANVRVCVEGNSQFHLSHGKKILVEAKSIEVTQKSVKPVPLEVNLEVCGVHPLHFLNEKTKSLAPTNSNEYYYATFLWKGEPEEISFNDLTKIGEIDRKAAIGGSVAKGEKQLQQGITKEENAAKNRAANYYLGACMGTSVITSLLRPVVGWGTAVINLLADCAIPYMSLTGDTNPYVKSALDFINTTFVAPLKAATEAITGTIASFITGALKLIGVGTNAENLDRLREPGAVSLDATEGIIGAFVDEAIVKNALLGQFGYSGKLTNDTLWAGGSHSDLAVSVSKTRVAARDISKGVSENIRLQVFGGKTTPQVNTVIAMYNQKLEEQISNDLLEGIEHSKRPGFGLNQYISVKDAEEIITKPGSGSIAKVEQALLRDQTYLKAISNARSSGAIAGSSGIKVDDVKKEVLTEIGKELEATRIPAQNEFLGSLRLGDPVNRTSLVRISVIEQKYRNALIDHLESSAGLNPGSVVSSNLGTKLGNIKLTIPSPDLSTSGATGFQTFTVNDQAIKNFQNQLQQIVLDEMNSETHNIAKLTTQINERIDKKLEQPITSKLGELGKEPDVKGAKPGFFSSTGQLQFWKNFLKEGAFGLLANYVGLKAYDWALQSELGKVSGQAKVREREEIAGAQALFLGQKLVPEDQFTKSILKYRTYRISVKSAQGVSGKEFRFGRVDMIPQDTKKEFLLNDCKNSGVAEEMGAFLPGFVPDTEIVSKFPKVFQKNREVQNLHVAAATNYLKKQENGERYGSFINSAVKQYALQFSSSGLNLEALVISVGMVKSGLGTDARYKELYMFGCDTKTDPGKADVYNNALCAARKISSYKDSVCQTKQNNLSCYLTAYNTDPANEKAGRVDVTQEEFKQIYDTWAIEYAWRAA